jgi:hypothetical protein
LPLDASADRHGSTVGVWIETHLRCSRLKPLPPNDKFGGMPDFVSIVRLPVYGKSIMV